MIPFILAAVGGYLIGDSIGEDIDSKIPKFSTGGVPSGAGMFSFSEWELMPNNRYYRKFLISKEDAISGKGRDITDLGVVESMEETDDGFYVVILSVTEAGKDYFEKKMGNKYADGGMMAKGGMTDVRMKYAKKDVNLLMKEGGMSMYDTKYGVLHLSYKDGVFTIKNNKYNPSKEDYETIFKGDKEGATKFVANSYIVDEMADGGMMAKGGMFDYSKFDEPSYLDASDYTRISKNVEKKDIEKHKELGTHKKFTDWWYSGGKEIAIKKYGNEDIAWRESYEDFKDKMADGGMMAKGGTTKKRSLMSMANLVIADEIESMKSMMESCYTYGSIDKDGYQYERYILPYKEKLGKELFDKVYKEESKRLKNYEVVRDVHTDSEGVSYNELKKRK